MYYKHPRIFTAFTREVIQPVRYSFEPILTFFFMVILICIIGYLFIHFAEPYFLDTVVDLINRNYPIEVLP